MHKLMNLPTIGTLIYFMVIVINVTFGHNDVDCRRIKFERDENPRYNKYQNCGTQNSPLRD